MTRRNNIGAQIRALADEIERLDPEMAPVFAGFEHSGGPNDPVRGHFQDGVVLGYNACLEHAHMLLAKVKERKLSEEIEQKALKARVEKGEAS